MGRKQVFISNILMVNDTGNPENNAKVFLYRYGIKIFENKIVPLLRPQNGIGIQEIDPFDFWSGAHFMLKVKKIANFPNYDGSMFLQPSPISDDEEIIESIWASEYSLKEFTDPKSFKTYDELSQRLQTVMGSTAPEPAHTNGNGSASSSSQEVEEFDELIQRLKR